MNKCSTSFFFLLLLPSFLFANGAEIKGRVVNEKKESIEFASIALLQEKDSTLAFANITDSTGNYLFTSIPYGRYLLAVSSAGTSREYYGPLVIDSLNGSIIVPDITLKQSSKELTEVEIRAIKPLFIHKPGMLIMDVEGSAHKSAGTAWDLLKKVPGVIIDNNNNITFRGKQGVNIMIDDKPTYLAGDQLALFLQNMSASEVVRIEIVTNPSAKFDAAGRAGYINIVTKKKVKQGLNGNVLLGAGYGARLKVGGGPNLSYGKNKFNFYGYYYTGRKNNLEELDIFRKITYSDTLTTFDQQSDMEEIQRYHNARVGFDYFPDSITSMGIVLSGRLFGIDAINTTKTSIALEPSDSAFSLQQTNIKDGMNRRASSGVYYKKILDTLGGEFSANADLLVYRNDAGEDFETRYFNKQHSETGIPYLQRNNTATDINIAVAKLDYAHGFKKHEAKLETGLKSSYVETDNSLHFDVQNNQVWENDSTRTNDFIYKEIINAAYLNGSFKWKNFGFQLGLRAEQTISDGNSPTLNKQILNQYMQLFPSVFIDRQIRKNHHLSGSYSRRIDRPSYEDLNPFIFYLDQYTFEKGNPFLKPQFTDALAVEYSLMDAVFLSTELSRTHDAMTDITEQIDSTGATFLTHLNLSTVDNAAFTLSFPIPIGKWFMAENSLTETYASYRSPLFDTELNRTSWDFSANSTFKFTLPKDWSIELNAEYQSKARVGLFDMKQQWHNSFGVTKHFFKKMLLFSISFADMFHKSYNDITINFQGQDVHLISNDETREVWGSLRYTFGQAQQKRKSGYKSASEDLQNRTNKK
ncbi:MAG: hypothetical protein EPN85_07220 [Bacteroidetes bacterium]|nr:MAG: hypothetical protein EPN85_07220 [Bacteroidota bacterium]